MATPVRVGTDANGRPVLMSRRMRRQWRRLCRRLGFSPTILQGAYMAQAGGGADASAGYHDGGGCLDLRVWDLTASKQERLIRAGRAMGWAVWLRDQRHGMDPHFHILLGCDVDKAYGASKQWTQYLNGRDGLASNGPDYHWRPDPLVTVPPPSHDKLRDLLDEAKDEAAHLGRKALKVALRKRRDNLPKW